MVSALKVTRKKKTVQPEPGAFDVAAINAAKRAGADTFEPPEFTREEKTVCLERWKARGKLACDDLFKLEPSGLTERDMRMWYFGLKQEAVHAMICVINASYSKTEVTQKLQQAGLEHIFLLMDEGLKETYWSVVKWLSD
jgi:hypothetical protein